MAETEADECNGTFRVQDINAEEMDFEIPSLKLENKGDIGAKARKILKKGSLRDELIKLFKPLREEIMSIEADQQKLEEDKAKREQAAQAREEIHAQTGELKDKMLQQQKEKELLLKQQINMDD